MSWVSKWWKNDGRERVLDTLRQTLTKSAKSKALDKLNLLLGMLDRTDIDGIRRELLAMKKYVEDM